MNKELIELQRGVSATCVIILDEFYKDLGQTVFMDANMKDVHLYGKSLGSPLFKEQIEKIAKNGQTTYFVIRKIDQITKEEQDRYIDLVKNREFHGYKIPDNVIIVFTIENFQNRKKISENLYHFCVVVL